MKTLVTYSTLTGNTKKVAEAVFEAVSGEKEIMDIKSIKETDEYDRILVGYWVDKGDANEEAKKFMETLKNKKVGTFGTLGAYPDSEHAQKCVEKISDALRANNNTVIAEFICQGAIDPKIIETMRKMGSNGPHAPTPEREARWAQAAKHPDEADFAAAKNIFGKLD